MARRSLLYVPGDRADRLPKALASGADGIIVDLEDSVDPDKKELARRAVRDWLSGLRGEPPAEVWVRVNSAPEERTADLEYCSSSPAVYGIVLPKATLDSIRQTIDLLVDGDGRSVRPLLLAPLIETASGVLDAEALARSERVSHMMYGQADLGAELGLVASPNEREWESLRFHLTVVSAAAGIDPPIGPAWTHLDDPDGLAASSGRLRHLGFAGRTAIHPAQLDAIHRAFAPTEAERAWASSVMAAFTAAEDEGIATAVSSDGEFIDRAVVRRAQRILADTTKT